MASFSQEDKDVPKFHDPTGKYTLKHEGAFPVVQVLLRQEDGPVSFQATHAKMLSMSGTADFKTFSSSGVLGGILKSGFTGTSTFYLHFFVRPDFGPGTTADVILAPIMPGEAMLLHVEDGGPQGWKMTKHALLAADMSVELGIKAQSLGKALVSGAGLFIRTATGTGRIVVSTYGSIMKFVLQPGEVRKFESGSLCTWSGHMNYSVGLATKSLGTTILSGEGFVASFTGPGVIFAQTRSVNHLREVVGVPS